MTGFRICYPTIQYFQASDGYRFAVRLWEVDRPKAEVVFVHGIVSHGGWYLESASYLAGRNFRVHFLDRRGSGLNLTDRGDVPSLDRWLMDVAEYISQKAPGRPRIICGISWGAKLAVALARVRPELCDAFAMIGPGIYAYQQAGVFKRFLLKLARSLGLRRIRVTIPLQDPHLFTENPRWIDFLAADPLSLRRVTVRFAVEDLRLNDLARTAAPEVRQPSLLMLAGRDRISDNERTRRFFLQLPEPKRLIEYPQAHHTLEFEPDPTPYFEDLSRWMEEQVATYRKKAGA